MADHMKMSMEGGELANIPFQLNSERLFCLRLFSRGFPMKNAFFESAEGNKNAQFAHFTSRS